MSAIAIQWAHQQKVGNQTAKQLLCFLSVQNFNKPGFYFKNSTLANILEVTVRSIQRAKQLLIDKNLIKVERQYDCKGKELTSVIYLNIPDEYTEEVIHRMENGGRHSVTPSLRGDIKTSLPRHKDIHPYEKTRVNSSKIKKNSKNSSPNNKYINNKSNNKKLPLNFSKKEQQRPQPKMWEPGHPDYDRINKFK